MAKPLLAILGLEPFDAGSHRVVRETISRHSSHQWTWLTRPGRAWKWRMRLAAIELIEKAHQIGAFDPIPDLIFTTSLLSASDLRGLLPAQMHSVPIVLYMHENQAAYPHSDRVEVQPQRDVHFALTNLTSALAADLVIFNSDWNRRSLLAGLENILDHAPDAAVGEWRTAIESRSTVIWPPVEPPPPPIDLENQMDTAEICISETLDRKRQCCLKALSGLVYQNTLESSLRKTNLRAVR